MAKDNIPNNKIVPFEQALPGLKAGKKFVPVSYVNDQGKIGQWIEVFDAGGSQILLVVTKGTAHQFGTGNDALFGDWVEVTESMLTK